MALAAAAWALAAPSAPTARTWFLVALLVPILHQLEVALAWRSELHGRALSRRFGRRAFTVHAVAFVVLLIARPVALLGLGLADPGSLGLSPALRIAGAAVLAAPSVATIRSIRVHFGVRRALGLDHFDEATRAEPLERRGVFRLVPNAMYVLGILGFHAIAVGCDSPAALAASVFQHLLVGVHWWATEKPDLETMGRLTPGDRARSSGGSSRRTPGS
jgi:hypothetical protein